MEVLPVKEYNRRAKARWDARIAEWKQKPIGAPMPQLVFFMFSDSRGNYRTRGFVASVADAHYWAETKKAAIALCHKNHSEAV